MRHATTCRGAESRRRSRRPLCLMSCNCSRKEPRNPGYLNLKAAILANLGDYRGSIETYEGVLARHPQQPKVWMSLGHALKTEGRQEESVAAYRRAISMEPTLGEAYWSLANLKTFRFCDRRCRGHGRSAEAHEPRRRGPRCISSSRSARRSRMRAHPAAPSSITARRTRFIEKRILTAPRRTAASWRAARPIHRGILPRNAPRGLPGRRPDLHRRTATRRINPARADTREPFRRRGNDRAAGHSADRARARSAATRMSRRRRFFERLAALDAAGAARPRRALPGIDARASQDRRALLHRQDAEQLSVRRPDPSDPAQRQDHRRPAPPARLLLLGLQAAFRPRTGLHLRLSRTSADTTASMSSSWPTSMRCCRAACTACSTSR